jgi:hypothetical protein
MKVDRFWPRVAAALAIVALVLVTNEGYRRVRGLVDTLAKATQDIALLKRDLYVLQVQLDTGSGSQTVKVMPSGMPAATAAPAAPAFSVPPLDFPIPLPMAQTPALPENPVRPRPKAQAIDEPKSLVSVVLMSDEKAAAAPASGGIKPADSPKMEVKLIGEAK